MANVLVKIHKWVDGALHSVEEFFEDVEEAIEHALGIDDADSVKVYDENGNCVHTSNPGNGTYP